MLLLNWLGRLVLRSTNRRMRHFSSERTRERRLTLMRLEQRRVLNADFTFNPNASLSLGHVDGQLTIREVSTHVEFDLTGSIWQDTGSSGLTVDNSIPNHSILSVDKSDLEALASGISIHAADPTQQLTLDTQTNALDLHSAGASLTIQDFGDVHQVGTHDFLTNSMSIDAEHSVSLENSSANDHLTLVANDSVLLNGTIEAGSASVTAYHGFISGDGSLSASLVDLHAETGIHGSTVNDAFSISATSISAVNSGSFGVNLSNATSLDASVTSLTTEGGDLEFSQQGGSVTFDGDVSSGHVSGGDITLLSTGGLTIADTDHAVNSGAGTHGTLSLHDATIHRSIHAGDGDIQIQGGDGDLLITGDLSATASIELSAHRDVLIESTVAAHGATSDLTITADSDSDGFGGFWLDEQPAAHDAHLTADHDITIVGSSLLATSDIADSLRIDADHDTQQVIAGHDLTLIGSVGFNVSTASDVVIDGRQTAIEGSLTIISHEQILLGADQTAGTDLQLQGAVRLTDDVSLLAGSDVIFGSTVDDDGSDATGSALTITAGDEVIFVGDVGGNTGDRLDTLTITNAGSVDFLNSVAVDGDIRVTTTSGGSTPEGRVNFQGPVTTTAGLATGSVEITNAGLLTMANEFTLAGSFTQDGAGTTELGADITTSNGDVFFGQAVLLTEDVTINTSNGSGDVTFRGTINSEETDGVAEHNSLTLSSGSGTIAFDADIGTGTNGDQTLGNLTILSAKQVIFGTGEFGGSDDSQPPIEAIALDGALDVGVGSNVISDGIVLNGGAFPLQLTTTDDSVRFNGAVTLASSVDINTNAIGDGGNVTFTSAATIDSEVSEFNDLTIDAGVHHVVFNNDLGATQSLGVLTITQADAGVVFGESDTDLGPGTTGPVTNIIADGPINIGVDSNVIIGGIVLNAGISSLLIATTDDTIRFNGAVTLSSSVEINSRNNTEGTGGTVTFTSSSTIDSQAGECNELTIDAGTQQVLFNGNIGAGVFGDQRLGSLTVTQADSGVIFGESDIDLGPGTTGPVTTIATCGPIDIGVASNVIGGAGIVLNAGAETLHITTIDSSVRFNGAVTLSSNLDIDTNATEDTGGGSVTFTSAASIDSEFGEANDLTIDAGTEQVLFNNDLGAVQSLGALTITQADGGVRFGQAELEGEADLGQIPFEVGLVKVINTDGPIDLGVGSHVIDGGIVLNGGSDGLVLTTTDDTVRFNGFVTLASDVSINTNATPETGGGTVTFTQAASIDSQLDENPEPILEHNDLTIDAGTQQVLFNNDIGAVQSLGALTITQADAGVIFGQSDTDLGPGTTGPVSRIVTDDAIDIGVDDHVIEGAGIVLNAGTGTLLLTTTDDNVRFNGAVTLSTSLDINTNATGIGGTVTFTEAASIDSQTGEFSDLTIDAGTGEVLFNNNLGESQSLGEFTIEQADGGVIFGQDDTEQGPGTTGPVSIITTDGPIDIGVGAHVIGGDGIVFNAGDGTLLITTNSDQPPLESDEPPLPELPRPVRFNGAVTLDSDVEINTTADGYGSLVDPADPDHTTFIGGRTVIFTNAATIDSGPLGEAKSLTIDAGTQQVLFNNDLGATDPLEELTILRADRGVVFGETDTVEDPGTTGPVRIIATDGAIDIGVGVNTINQPVDPTDSSSNVVGIVLNAGSDTLMITTTDDPVRFNGPVTLESNVNLNTNTGGIGGTVTFTSAATIDSDAVNDEHNDLIIDAGTQFVLFNNNIGATQSLGQFLITQADEGVFFGQSDVDEGPGTTGPVNTIIAEGTIDIGVGSNVITGGIQLNGGLTPDYELNPVLIQSNGADIRFNGLLVSTVEPLDSDGNPIDLPAVDLTINAASGVTLTGIAFDGDGNVLPDGGGILTDDYNVVINGDTDDDAVGDLTMGANTVINSNDGFIDIRAANVFLGELLSANTNSVDVSDPVTGAAPAVRVVATFGSITDVNDDFVDGEPVEVLNIQANNRDFFEVAYADLDSLLTATATTLTLSSVSADLQPFSIIQIEGEQMRVMAISDDMLTLTVQRGVNGTVAADHDGTAGTIGIVAFQQDAGPTVVLDAVLGIGSTDAIETDIASLYAVNHDLNGVAGTSSGNIQITDMGGSAVVDRDNPAIAFHHRVDLLFVQNQADPLVPGDTDNGVIDINIENGDLRVVDDGSPRLHDELTDSSNLGTAIPAVQSENTIHLTADTIEILDDIRAIQDPAGVNSGDEFFETIQIDARADFYMAANRVITTDENYTGSLSIPNEDVDHDGVLDVNEDANGNGKLDVGEDLDGDGRLDVEEDLNGNGVLDPTPKPSTFADDTHQDVVHIVADFDAPLTSDPFIPPGLNGLPDGKVFLALGSTISTDSGVEQQIAPRPEKLPSDAKHFIYTSDSAFFSGEIVASNLQSVTMKGAETVYLGTLTFTIGVAGEKNLVLDIDWGDLTPLYQDNVLAPTAPTTPGGPLVFNATVDQHATRFLIPEGGVQYSIPHEYSQNALNMKDEFGNLIIEPGRVHPSDPMQVRFSVSQHPSILVEGQSVLNPDGLSGPYVPLNVPYDVPSVPPVLVHEGLYNLTSTDVSDNPDAFLPRLDNGVVAFTIPTAQTFSLPLNRDSLVPPPELPRITLAPASLVTPAQLTTETIRGAAAGTSVTTDEFFELRRINEDGSIEFKERLTGDYDGELLLSNKDRFEEFIRERGDGDYEIWFITRDNREGALIERPVIQFRLESGHFAEPSDASLKTFKPLKLIPVPGSPMPEDSNGNDGDGAESNDESDSPKLDEDANNNAPVNNSTDEDFSANDASADERLVMTDHVRGQDAGFTPDANDDLSSSAAPIAAGALVFASTRRWKRRSKPSGVAPFSKAARLNRKLIATSGRSINEELQ